MCECVKFPFGKAWSARHQVRFFQQFAGTIIQAHLWPCSSTHLHPVLLPLDSHPGGILNINSILFQDTESKSSVRENPTVPSPTENLSGSDRSLDFCDWPSIYPEKHPTLQCIRKVHSDFFQPGDL